MFIKAASLFFVFAVISAVSLATEVKDNEAKIEKDTVITTDSTAVDSNQNKIVAYYFHQTRRCPSCKKIETYTDEAVTTRFADELKAGNLEWAPINVDIEGNEHFMDDYELFTKSVILSRVEKGKEVEWKNLKKIWELLNSKEKFMDYIESELKEFMNKK